MYNVVHVYVCVISMLRILFPFLCSEQIAVCCPFRFSKKRFFSLFPLIFYATKLNFHCKFLHEFSISYGSIVTWKKLTNSIIAFMRKNILFNDACFVPKRLFKNSFFFFKWPIQFNKLISFAQTRTFFLTKNPVRRLVLSLLDVLVHWSMHNSTTFGIQSVFSLGCVRELFCAHTHFTRHLLVVVRASKPFFIFLRRRGADFLWRKISSLVSRFARCVF